LTRIPSKSFFELGSVNTDIVYLNIYFKKIHVNMRCKHTFAVLCHPSHLTKVFPFHFAPRPANVFVQMCGCVCMEQTFLRFFINLFYL